MSPDRLQSLHRIAQRQHRRAGLAAGRLMVRGGWRFYAAVELAARWVALPGEWLIGVGFRLIRHCRAPP